jgi:hypothetical protein
MTARFFPENGQNHPFVPVADPELDTDVTFPPIRLYSSVGSPKTTHLVIRWSPAFTDVQRDQYDSLFINKCSEASKICDFSLPYIMRAQKRSKSTLLMELAQAFTLPFVTEALTAEAMSNFRSMILSNMSDCTISESGNGIDASWLHLSLVYDALIASFKSTNIITSILERTFIHRIAKNLLSPDPRERCKVRDAISSLYQNTVNVRKTLIDVLFQILTDRLASVEMLQFIGSIANSFYARNQQDAITFFRSAIIPLFGSPAMPQNIASITILYADKDPVIFAESLKYILTHWPVANPKKQIQLTEICQEFLARYWVDATAELAQFAFQKVGQGICSVHVDTSLTSLRFFRDQNVVLLLQQFPKTLSMVISAMRDCESSHWEEFVRGEASFSLFNLPSVSSQRHGSSVKTSQKTWDLIASQNSGKTKPCC